MPPALEEDRKESYRHGMIDLHCDTLLRIWEDGGQNSLASNPYSVDLDGLEKAGALAQCFAIFTPPEGDRWATMRALHDIFVREMEVNAGRISQAYDAADIASRRLSAILTIEDMGATEAKEERIDEVLSWSPRIISLVWNNENAFACPNSPDSQLMAKGLKKAGHELIERMGGHKMVLDVSHLSDGGF